MTSHFCNFFQALQTLIFKLTQMDKSNSQILSLVENLHCYSVFDLKKLFNF